MVEARDGDRPGPITITETGLAWSAPPGWEDAEADAPPQSITLATERTQTGKWLIIRGSGYTAGQTPWLTLQNFPGMPSWTRKRAQESAHPDGTFTHYDFFPWYPPQYPEDPETSCYVWAHDGEVGHSLFAIESITAGHLYVLPWSWAH